MHSSTKFMSLLNTFYDLLIRGDVNINEQTVQLISLTLVLYSVESVQSKILNTVASKIRDPFLHLYVEVSSILRQYCR
jgi:hypothetical protein